MCNPVERRRTTQRATLVWLLAAVLGVASLPSAALAQEATARIPDAVEVISVDGGPVWAMTTGEASLRGQPDIADNRFGFARPSTPLQILGYSGEWAYVFNPHTQGTAYVFSNLLTPAGPPSTYVSKAAPPLVTELYETVVLTEDSILTTYPSTAPEAVFTPLKASNRETVIGTVLGEDGGVWYQTNDFYYFPSTGVFQPSESGSFSGRWLEATLYPTTKVVAYEGQTPMRTMLALRGVQKFPTPTGIFSIMRRVPNETMDSTTLGIPRNSPFGYYVTNVLYTQYFTPDGASLHDNYWSSNFGGAGSHGCLGLSFANSKWLWDWATIGTPVIVNP